MHVLSHLDLASATILALVLGAALAFSFLHQMKLQRLAQHDPRDPRAKLWERFTFAGLSFGILFAIIVAGKHVSALSYEYFMLVAAVSASACLIYRWWRRKSKQLPE